jgi:ATP-binding cassette subfamily B protein
MSAVMPMRDKWRSFRVLVRLTFTASPLLATTEIALVIAMAVAGPLQSYGVASIVNAVTRHHSLVTGAVILLITLVVAFGGLVISDAIRSRLEDEIEATLQREMLGLATSLPGIAHHEQPEIADRIGAAREEFRRLRGTAGTIASGLTVLFSTGTVLVLLASIHPVLLVLPAIGLLRLWASARTAHALRQAITTTMQYNRRHTRLLQIAENPRHGLEIRAFGMREPLTDRLLEAFELQNTPRWNAQKQGRLMEVTARGVFGLAYGAAIVFVLWLARHGHATPGDVTMVMLLAPQTDQAAQKLSTSVRALVGMLDIAGHVQWLRDYAIQQNAWSGSDDPPRALQHGIELRHVAFAYPDTKRAAVHDVNVSIPAGSTVALVGDNGAGKSTVVKLLSRLYDPTAGQILIDNTDLSTISPQAWRHRISAGFQDFVKYQYTARETIGLGEPTRLDRPDPEYDDAIDAGDARTVIERLPHGLDTQLGKRFGGTDLSGGQWQRLALARAFLREQPLLVLLDEPAASLDPESEQALFDRFTAASTAARATGGITLLVSHRLSTVRNADLILVFDNGTVTEIGTHDELIAADGQYAELFQLQADAYK